MRPINGRSKVLGILGNPLGHSFSPIMHNAAMKALDMDAVYVPLETPLDRVAEAVAGLRALNFLGANVTQPFKQSVIPHLDSLSPLSEVLGAVNTIVNREGVLWGTSTDGQGFIQSFHENGLDFSGMAIALFGAGGAARSILFSLAMEEKPGDIFLLGRSEAALEALAGECLEKTGRAVHPLPINRYGEIQKKIRLLVNTTPVGMAPHFDDSVVTPEQLEPGQIVFDIIYNPKETRLLSLARIKNLTTIGGLGMLVHQGVASFEHWTGVKTDPEIYFNSLKNVF